MEKEAKSVRLPRAEYERMLREAISQAPLEACGLIAGQDAAENVCVVEKVYVLTNTDASPEHFSLEPREQLAAIQDMRRHGWKPLGNWHSHPATPSRPSEEDKRLAFDPGATYMILSLAGETPVLNAFHIEGMESRAERLEIID